MKYNIRINRKMASHSLLPLREEGLKTREKNHFTSSSITNIYSNTLEKHDTWLINTKCQVLNFHLTF